MTLSIDRASLDHLRDIGVAAGAAAMVHYHDRVEVATKTDASPVTAADLAAQSVIVARLTRWDPAVPIVSEESAVPGYDARRTWGDFWLVDPLDGTKEFINRNGEFTVNVALVRGGRPVLGMVYAPAQALMYVAGEGLGSWRAKGTDPLVRIFATRPTSPQRVIVESRSHPSEELERFLATIPVDRRVRAGSSVKFCLVAEGSADLYPRFGPTMEWDVAAGDCIWRNAAPTGANPSPLRYNKPDLKNDSFVIGWSPVPS